MQGMVWCERNFRNALAKAQLSWRRQNRAERLDGSGCIYNARPQSEKLVRIISFAYELRIPCSEQFRTRDNSPQRGSFRWYCTGTNCSPPRQPKPSESLPFQIELKGNQRISRPTPLSSSSSSAPTIISYWLTDATYGTEELTISFLWPCRAQSTSCRPAPIRPPSLARHQTPPITRPNCAYRWINIGISTLSLKGGCCRQISKGEVSCELFIYFLTKLHPSYQPSSPPTRPLVFTIITPGTGLTACQAFLS